MVIYLYLDIHFVFYNFDEPARSKNNGCMGPVSKYRLLRTAPLSYPYTHVYLQN